MHRPSNAARLSPRAAKGRGLSSLQPRDGSVSFDPRTPRMLGADSDADARSPRDVADAKTAIFHEESIPKEIEAVLRQRNPHRHRQIAGAAAELVLRQH